MNRSDNSAPVDAIGPESPSDAEGSTLEDSTATPGPTDPPTASPQEAVPTEPTAVAPKSVPTLVIGPAIRAKVPLYPRVLARFDRFSRASQPVATGQTDAVARLREAPPNDRLLSWIVTLVIVLLALGLRLVGLGYPSNMVFDETYYAKDAWSLLQHGYERAWVDGANDILFDHDFTKAQTEDPDAVEKYCPDGTETCTWNGLKDDPGFIVHPQVGKWLIAAGEAMFGFNAFGWRFMAAVFGSLLILVTIRLGRRLSRSTLIGGLAGLLLTFDGLAFVMSRTALLDIFQAFFLVAGVGCVVADRDWFRHRLADRIERLGNPSGDLAGQSGGFIFRPWLIAAGVIFGLACGTKWNSMFVLAVFGVLTVVWSVSARRLAGAGHRKWDALWLDGVPAFVSMVIVAVVVYAASWFSWLTTPGGWDRAWGASNPDDIGVKVLGAPLGSLLHYNTAMYDFHVGDGMAAATHTYSSNPWGWLVMARPIGFDAQNGIQPGTDGCPPGGEECLRVISAAGTPLLWWAAAITFILGLIWWLAGADWRFGVVSLATLATWVPWVGDTVGRPLFFFYAITLIPFLCIGLAMALGVLMGPANAGRRRFRGTILAGTVVGLIILDFAFIYPILTDGLLLRSHWDWRMWFGSWI